jgi:hypothetical protein
VSEGLLPPLPLLLIVLSFVQDTLRATTTSATEMIENSFFIYNRWLRIEAQKYKNL